MLEPAYGLLAWKIVALLSLIGYPASLIWAYRDAEQRGRNGLLLAIFVGITWLVGLVVWLTVRPNRVAASTPET